MPPETQTITPAETGTVAAVVPPRVLTPTEQLLARAAAAPDLAGKIDALAAGLPAVADDVLDNLAGRAQKELAGILGASIHKISKEARELAMRCAARKLRAAFQPLPADQAADLEAQVKTLESMGTTLSGMLIQDAVFKALSWAVPKLIAVV